MVSFKIQTEFRFAVMFPLLSCFLCTTFPVSYATDTFHEELFIKPLPSGRVYTYFQFTTLWDNNHFDHCRLFPLSLAEIVRNHDVQELHVTLTQGMWRYRYWGYPFVDAAPGAEVWAWFEPNTTNIDWKWKSLTSALSGLLCASFNFVDGVNSISPQMSLRPQGVTEGPSDSAYLRYATLPREVVCTENLTPWKKLLPCTNRGLSLLLNSRHVHNTNYHSLGIRYRQICHNCRKPSVELRLTVSLVYDLAMLNLKNEWLTSHLFGSSLPDACPLANTSSIYVDVTPNSGIVQLSGKYEEVVNLRGGTISKYAVLNKWQPNDNLAFRITNVPKIEEPLLYANRFLTQYGRENGGIVTRVRNNMRKPTTILYLETVPWYVPLYYHTLKITRDGTAVPTKWIRYVPGKMRESSYVLEVLVEIPAKSTIEISIEFDYMFLKWQEYPPDANHGFYVGSAIVTAVLPFGRNYTALDRRVSIVGQSWNRTNKDDFPVYLRTEAFILGLPTPDFSMPYNVICLSCTVVALAFGPLHNITIKQLRFRKGKVTLLGQARNAVRKAVEKAKACISRSATE